VKRFVTIRLAIGSVAALAAMGATGCNSGPRTPDEFRVMRKAPLTVPPEYNLRPPTPGSARPQELSPDVQARVAVFGTDLGREASEGEKAFVAAAGGDATDRSVRAQVDFDSAQIIRKNRGFADAILNFGRGQRDEAVIDAAAEQERLRAEEESLNEVTGGREVLIRRKNTSKLPGL
jgi:hypothetical protein